jgi:hypothetical protein
MAKPRPEKKREEKSPPPAEQRVLPMQLKVGDRLVDETGEYDVVGRPYTAHAGKNVHVRVRRVDDPATGSIRGWPAHQRIVVKRTGGGNDSRRGD